MQTLIHSSRHKVYFYVSSANYCEKDSSCFWKKSSIVCLFLVYENSRKIWGSFEWRTVKITEKLKFSRESSSLCAYNIKIDYFQTSFFHLLHSFHYWSHRVLINGISYSLWEEKSNTYTYTFQRYSFVDKYMTLIYCTYVFSNKGFFFLLLCICS